MYPSVAVAGAGSLGTTLYHLRLCSPTPRVVVVTRAGAPGTRKWWLAGNKCEIGIGVPIETLRDRANHTAPAVEIQLQSTQSTYSTYTATPLRLGPYTVYDIKTELVHGNHSKAGHQNDQTADSRGKGKR